MAHFARIDEENKVTQVTAVADAVLDDNGTESEAKGIAFLKSLYGDSTNWVQCSYNTWEGKHHDENGDESADQSKALRGHFPGNDWTYDASADAFVPPQPFASWTYDAANHKWVAPVTLDSQVGDTQDIYKWDEATTAWVRLGSREDSANGLINDEEYIP